MALCFGVNSVLSSDTMIALSKAGMLSADGRCKTFDHSANGYVRGEGCGGVLLKHDSDGEAGMARVLGFAINQDGKTVVTGSATARIDA